MIVTRPTFYRYLICLSDYQSNDKLWKIPFVFIFYRHSLFVVKCALDLCLCVRVFRQSLCLPVYLLLAYACVCRRVVLGK